jgi:hypothetical protein
VRLDLHRKLSVIVVSAAMPDDRFRLPNRTLFWCHNDGADAKDTDWVATTVAAALKRGSDAILMMFRDVYDAPISLA